MAHSPCIDLYVFTTATLHLGNCAEWACQVSCSFLGCLRLCRKWRKDEQKKLMNSESFIRVDSQLKQLEKRPIITLQVWNPQNSIVKENSSSNSLKLTLAVGYNHFLLYFFFLPNNSGHIYWVAFPIKSTNLLPPNVTVLQNIPPTTAPTSLQTMPHF